MILDRYYYNQLSLAQQILYRKLYEAMLHYNEYIICGENDYTENDFSRVLYIVKIDNPDVFYVQSTFSIEKTAWGLIKLHLKYFFEKKDKEKLNLELEKCLQQIVPNMNIKGKDQEEIAKDIHDFLIRRSQVEINDESSDIEKCAIIETLLENKITAQGVAYTYKYLLNLFDVKCNIICGNFSDIGGKSSSRTWNCITLYGEERCIDLYEDALNSNNQKICYDYFGLTNEMMQKNYSIDVTLPVFIEENSSIKIDKAVRLKKASISPAPIDLFNTADLTSLNVNDIIHILKHVQSDVLFDDIYTIIEKFIQKLENLKDIESQYPDEKEYLENGIMVHIPYLIKILQEYYRYKKYSAALDLTLMVYEKLSRLVDTLIRALQYNMDIFWKRHASDMLNDISEMQQNLISGKKNRDQCPVNIDDLNEESDINDFISVLEYLKFCGLPQKINEQIIQMLESLCCLRQQVAKNSDRIFPIAILKNYYLPEAIRLIFRYEEYENEGISRQRLDDLYENIKTSLMAVNNAIHLKLEEIYEFETMEIKARAKALADIIGQDGFVDLPYKINN